MSTLRTCEFLDGRMARYALIKHSQAYTAQEVAESAHIPGRNLAKTVVLQLDGEMALAVVPATRDVDLTLISEVSDAGSVELVPEREFVSRFQGCEVGSMPPIGVMFDLPTYVDRSMAKEPYIAFNAGTHHDVIVMSFDEYRRIATPRLVDIAFRPEDAYDTQPLGL